MLDIFILYHLWNASTYIEIIGHISEEAVEKYIQDQKTK